MQAARPSAATAQVSLPDEDDSDRLIAQLLTVARRHLQMEVAFISRVAAGRRVFEFVDSDPHFSPVRRGEGEDVAHSYCGRVLSGRIPQLIPDAANEPGVADIAATWQLPIGAHLSVPIVTPDGRTYGTMCCFSRLPDATLSDRDVDVLRIFAEVVSAHLEPLAARHEAQATARAAVTRVLDDGGPSMALQPIVSLADGGIGGYEALARFAPAAGGPDEWFRAAAFGGLGTALESAAVHAAVRLVPRLPESAYLAVNVSAAALLDSASIVAMFTGPCTGRLVLELTEHHRIDDQGLLDEVLDRIRRAGGRIAVDDAGSGYAGLERILALRPEVLKLDRTLVDGVADHPGRQAMCQAMVGFTRRVGADLVAEGVETTDDLLVLRSLGVSHAQGYLLGRPRVPEREDHVPSLHSAWIDAEPAARQLLADGGDGAADDTAGARVVELTDSLEDTVRYAERCRHLIGPEADAEVDAVIEAALRLHRRSTGAVLRRPAGG